MQFVSAGQRVVPGERVGKSRNRLVQQVEYDALGKRTRRSLTDSPRLGELLARERRLLVTRTRIGRYPRLSDRPTRPPFPSVLPEHARDRGNGSVALVRSVPADQRGPRYCNQLGRQASKLA